MNNSHAGKDRYLENMADYARAHGCTADVCPQCWDTKKYDGDKISEITKAMCGGK